ncbi:MAG: adenylyltransferase/cytidyltransferase family protein [Clostridiales bacterium]|nr:adenylyltransferase/cytidyltransferase family protein [Clostridiales bacterium]
MKKYKVGYTAGVYDMFHVGHLNIIMNAKQYCEHLIVAVSTDEVVWQNKHKKPIINFKDRVRIVEAIRYVDMVVPQNDYMDKKSAAIKYGIDVMFVGDDWKGTEKWNRIEKELSEINVDVVYLPHTEGISSTVLREKMKI